MALTEMYLTSTKNLPAFLDSLRSAQPPDKFTLKFLEDLGFKSTNDRLLIGLLKAIKFIDESGTPTKRYFAFLDDSQWKQVLAEGIIEAYEDLFRLNKRADKLGRPDLVGKIKSLTEGKKSDSVLPKYIATFTELVKLADFDTQRSGTPVDESRNLNKSDGTAGTGKPTEKDEETKDHHITKKGRSGGLIDAVTYRIEIVLPPARDQAVYDAIFRSLKEHLL